MKLWHRVVIVIALLAALSACGVRTAYNNLDWLVMRWVNDQVTLSDEQAERTESRLEALIEWHCASELPDYHAFLIDLRGDLGRDSLDAGDLAGHADTLYQFWQRLVDRGEPVLIDLLATLDEEQIEEIEATFQESNQEYESDSVDINSAQWQDRQVANMRRGLRRFIGRPDADQMALLLAWSQTLEPNAELHLAQRRAWQDQFLEALALREQPERFDAAFRELRGARKDWPEDYRERLEHNRERTLEVLADVHATLSDRQRQRLDSRLASLGRDFERLACQG